jgi:ferredoxin
LQTTTAAPSDIASAERLKMEPAGLASLLSALWAAGYRVIGPTVGDGAIVYGEVRSLSDLPQGLTDQQEAGQYRLVSREDRALFGFHVGPHSLKRLLLPPKERLFATIRKGSALSVVPEPIPTEKIAFLGAKACEIQAMLTQDQVLVGGAHPDVQYLARRNNLLIIGTSCTSAGGTCFCTSMGGSPRVDAGADLALTEVISADAHYFVVETKTALGASLIEPLHLPSASVTEQSAAALRVADAATQMGRHLATDGLKELIARSLESPHWDSVATRCLSCANCTLVCPTCFCSTVEDVTDLAGDHSERWRRWDSCFHDDFSYLHGGSVRQSVRSRYRQWLSHKLSTWIDQFGRSGCVGCGRCITFCPVGIDLTAECATLQARHS